jgi:hypothetical protein
METARIDYFRALDSFPLREKMKTSIIRFQSVKYIAGDLSGYHSYCTKTEEIRDDRIVLKSFITVKKARN